ncbi:MAG: NUDIX domain-containing protein [Ruminococcus sp.]|nr:NUDIX domain-containing protein [Ruminococcus sp.]
MLSEFFKSKREKPSNKYELWDLFDKGRLPVGKTHLSVNPLPEGCYSLKVLVLVKSTNNELLLVKPTSSNDLWSGIGGTVVAGESSLNGACRKLMENGIRRKKEELKFLKAVCSHHSFVDCYELKTAVFDDEIKLRKAEFEEFKWVELDKIHEFNLSDELLRAIEKLR